MILLGITGGIGHGKTSLAEALAACAKQPQLLETSTVIAEVIDALQTKSQFIPNIHDPISIERWLAPLPKIVSQKLRHNLKPQALKLDISAPEHAKLSEYLGSLQANPMLGTQPISPTNKDHYGVMLQWLGNFLVQNVSPAIWYDELMRRAAHAKAEGADLCIVGGVRYPSDAASIRANDGLVVAITRPNLAETDLADPTERERKQIAPDITIINDGTISQLRRCAQALFDDTKQAEHNTYIASNY